MYIVSLTSFDNRLQIEAPVAVQSILNNKVLPDKICIVVDDFDKDKVPTLFIEHPLIEIIYSDLGIKSHNKYYHTMLKYPNDVIITIDDDIEYPNTFIEDCIRAYEQYPEYINACRVHKIRFNSDSLLPYKLWEWESKDLNPSFYLFFTSGAGTVFPPGVFNKEDFILREIYDYIYTDDIYLNALARRKKILIKRIPVRNRYRNIKILQNKFDLCSMNVAYNNDRCLKNIKFSQLIKALL